MVEVNAPGAAEARGVRSYRWPVAHALRRLGGLSAAAGDSVRAARLFGAVAALGEVGWTIPLYRHDPNEAKAQAAARAARDDPVLATAHAEGAGMTLDEAVAYALSDEAVEAAAAHTA